ncbi:MAG: lectin-like protein [Candidatus Poseidoniaceae archaeon]
MGTGDDSYIDYGKYQASLEDLSFRNRSILLWFSFGIIWLFLNIFVFNILWFWEEFYFAISEVGWQVVTENSDGTQCVVTEYESCERLVGSGGVWWSLLGSLTTGIAVGPLVFSALILSYRNKDVTKKWKDEIWGLLFLINPSIIWALLFLICLPYAWTLLPWGEWSTNWWKIFPFGFGLIWLGGLPPILVISNFFKKLFNREYNSDITVEAGIMPGEDSEEGQIPTQPTASEVANSVDARSSYIEAGIPPEPSLGGSAIFVAILAALMIIPGIVLLIIGGVMAEEFIEGEGSSSYTLEIIDEDSSGDQGFIIFIQATPGDFNGNGMHDYCENIIVNANHSGAWMSDPWQGMTSDYNEADETRQVFELEISHRGSGCDTQHWPKEKWVNDIQLVKIGRACYGCMAGNTTITAEYAPESETEPKPVGMWIQDGEKIKESTTLTIIGAILAGIGGATLTIIIIVIISKSKAAAMQDSEGEKESIEIIESNPGQPVRFRIDDPPKGRDAWVGIYPPSAGDQDHGDRWSWLRDIDVNNATLPGQTAGKWSIRVFKDGGYKLQHRVDFEISSSSQHPKTSTSRNGMNQSHACDIHILEARAGKPIRFNVNNRPSGNEAWFGLYPDRAIDQEHGEMNHRWMYFRDVAQQNTLYLPPQSAGRWSIRVFSDGGYNQIERLDFDITGAHGNVAQLHPADGRYELAPEELSWNEHNERALALGGHLVSITSAEENELVARIAGGRVVWIGGMRKGSGNGPGADHWYWCDGQPWIYANWAPGEPNNYGGSNENRIHLNGQNKLWNDVGEGWRGPAVYQLPKEKSIQSAKKIQSALKQSAKEKKDNFWDSV